MRLQRKAEKRREMHKKFREMQRIASEMQRNEEKCMEMQRNAEKFSEIQRNADILMTFMAFMTFMTHWNVIFDILEPPAFRKYVQHMLDLTEI